MALRVTDVPVPGASASSVWALATGAWFVIEIVTMAGAEVASPSEAVNVNVSVPCVPASAV